MKHVGVQLAFTLIELLVVIAIIISLAAMILAIVASSGTSGDQQNTKALIVTVAAAIDQFTNETGSVPLPTGSHDDPQSGTWYPAENDGQWDKQQLWWRLSSSMGRDENKAMRDAAEKKDLEVNPYQSQSYMEDTYKSSSTRRTKVDEIMATIPDEDVDKYRGTYAADDWAYYGKTAKGSDAKPWNDKSKFYGLSYRGAYKSYILAARAAVAKDLEQRKYITYACLEREDLIDDSFLQNYTLVDAWGMPLIYVAHSTVSFKERRPKSGSNPLLYYGLTESGRADMTDRDGNGFVDLHDWTIEPPDLADRVDWNNDGTVDESDWGSILYNSKPGRSKSFYLASAGPDMLFNCLYAKDENVDNIEMEYKE